MPEGRLARAAPLIGTRGPRAAEQIRAEEIRAEEIRAEEIRAEEIRAGAIRAGALIGALCLLAAGCSSDGRSTEGGYVGTSASRVNLVAPDQRVHSVRVSGPQLGEDRKTLSTTDLAGKVVVINVWGSWCPPCRQEATELESASRRTKGKAAFVGITTKDYDPGPAEAFVRAFKITYPSIYDPTGSALLSLSGELPPSAIPSTLVLDAQGRVAARVLGTVDADTLVGMVDDVAAGK